MSDRFSADETNDILKNIREILDKMSVTSSKEFQEINKNLQSNVKIPKSANASLTSVLRDNDDFSNIANKYISNNFKSVNKAIIAGIQDVLTGEADFKKRLKGILSHALNKMLTSLYNFLGQQIFSFLDSFRIFGGGFLGGALNLLSSFGLFHSGGVVPRHHSGFDMPYSSYALGGTSEQLAILKGGERVLSPAENVSYEKGGNVGTVQVLNFNVKAWDSKDVASYFKENASMIRQITAAGIKNNQDGLRTVIKGVG